MRSYAIVEAPSMLGTSPRFGGVRHGPAALLDAGLAEALGGARRAGRVEPPAYVAGRDPQTQVTNAHGLREYALRLADAVGDVLARGGRRPPCRSREETSLFRDVGAKLVFALPRQGRSFGPRPV